MATRLTDRNGRLVEQFHYRMGNLGFQHMADEIVRMLDSGVWQDWKDGIGRVQLLPGEFDYFLSMMGVTRDAVVNGVRDMAIKARLDGAMDERRSGEANYRRRYEEVKAIVGPHRNAAPFGYTSAEAKALVNGDSHGVGMPKTRDALGSRVRQYSKSTKRRPKTADTKFPAERRSRVEQLEGAIVRLSDEEFAELNEWLPEHRRQRRRKAKA